jgi:hypothetical protein
MDFAQTSIKMSGSHVNREFGWWRQSALLPATDSAAQTRSFW